MSLADRLNAWAEETNQRERARRDVRRRRGQSVDPHALTDDDLHAWERSARDPGKPFSVPGLLDDLPNSNDYERKDFLAWVRGRNRRRLVRLGRDLDWLRREARVYGLDPKEIKWLL
jgi:hypothetical protein